MEEDEEDESQMSGSDDFSQLQARMLAAGGSSSMFAGADGHLMKPP